MKRLGKKNTYRTKFSVENSNLDQYLSLTSKVDSSMTVFSLNNLNVNPTIFAKRCVIKNSKKM